MKLMLGMQAHASSPYLNKDKKPSSLLKPSLFIEYFRVLSLVICESFLYLLDASLGLCFIELYVVNFSKTLKHEVSFSF
jgi:hypothetical protein